ncbi:MAG: hypothetical protein ABIH76_08625 [Candidatus Bathyarchaeota archaeon]
MLNRIIICVSKAVVNFFYSGWEFQLEAKKCFTSCEFFRCSQREIQFRGNGVYCKSTEDLCDGPSCTHAICIRNRLLADGLCGLTVKNITGLIDTSPEKIVSGVKVKGRLQQRFKEKELY